jgi:uracil-DNA glycosylase family 4
MPTALQAYYLRQMGIDLYLKRPLQTKTRSLDDIADEVSQCQRCPLHQTRTQTVFGRGSAKAKLMIIGEAPGLEEDQHGSPFVGPSGDLLNKMLAAMDFTEEDVYIANVLKCRPPDNRDPKQEEMAQCADYLIEQIQLISPRVIMTLGSVASHFLLDTKVSISQLRGQRFIYQGTPLIVSYHPSYLLRKPSEKRKAYADWLLIRRLLDEQK